MKAAVPAPTRGPTCFQPLPGHMRTLAASAAMYSNTGARCSTCARATRCCRAGNAGEQKWQLWQSVWSRPTTRPVRQKTSPTIPSVCMPRQSLCSASQVRVVHAGQSQHRPHCKPIKRCSLASACCQHAHGQVQGKTMQAFLCFGARLPRPRRQHRRKSRANGDSWETVGHGVSNVRRKHPGSGTLPSSGGGTSHTSTGASNKVERQMLALSPA